MQWCSVHHAEFMEVITLFRLDRHFAVVVFNDGSTSLISPSWLQGEEACFWPPSGNIRKLAKSHAVVQDDWTLNSCRIIGTAGISSIIMYYYSSLNIYPIFYGNQV
jgi:hypothetical protein